MAGRPLRNPRHEAFCQYYVFGHPPVNGKPSTWRDKPRRNATRSYEAAGYEAEGHVAKSAAGRLLRRPEVQDRIKQLEKLRRAHGDGD